MEDPFIDSTDKVDPETASVHNAGSTGFECRSVYTAGGTL